ncbi:MAG: hypothetical protein K2K21_16640 [Lachnospiraceae bacterium]|nr:hypothetical protein [Lachnospiraceae bacterium]
MYKYKPIRYIFRAFCLIVYAAIASIMYITISNEIYISDIMESVFHNYYLDLKRAIFLAAFLIANMLLILIFRLVCEKKTEALLYYICDFIIRITFSVPVSFIVFYFVLFRFCGDLLGTPVVQAIVVAALFVVTDCAMRLQIRYQLGVNYFKIADRL